MPTTTIPKEAEPLLSLLDRPDPPLLLVVGTGISYGATGDELSTWRGLLNHAVDLLERQGTWSKDDAFSQRHLINKSFDVDFDLNEVLQRADSITKALGGRADPRYAAWLSDSLGRLKVKADRTDALNGIRDLVDAGALVLTTNYDDVLVDALGLPPITWQEPQAVLEVVNRKRKGIIHIHGHWRHPGSVVFGKESYDEIVKASVLQSVFTSLWLQWHWLYVGAGAGLEDPNLGQLLEWGNRHFHHSSPTDYFLGKEDTVDKLNKRSDKLANVVPISYRKHADLPDVLKALTPQTRCAPFQRIEPGFSRFRQRHESTFTSPFPSWQEHLEDKVPRFAGEIEAERRIQEHGWATVCDVASVGKTTFAMQLATTESQRDLPSYYLAMRQTRGDDATFAADAFASLQRIARPGVLIILDDGHHNPELVHDLWQKWQERPLGSRLLIVATRIEHAVSLAGDNALTPILQHSANAALSLRPGPDDLGKVFVRVMARLDTVGAPSPVVPPPSVLAQWYETFGSEIGAFVVALIQRRTALLRGNWDLPAEAASDWVQERHLKHLSPEEIDNVICLAVFGAQELELDVPVSAIPHPKAIGGLLRRGLVERIDLAHGQYTRYGLREPGWGQLILAALIPSPDVSRILVDTTRRSPVLLVVLTSRLRRAGRTSAVSTLWEAVAQDQTALLSELWNTSLSYVTNLVVSARSLNQASIVSNIWETLASDPVRLTERAFRESLNVVAAFMATASEHGQTTLVAAVWKIFVDNPKRLRAFDAPLGALVAFVLEARKREQGGVVEALCSDLTADTNRLAESVFNAPLTDLANFIATASEARQTKLVEEIWKILANDPKRLAEHAFESPLNMIATFTATAQEHQQIALIANLWKALADDPKRLAERALGAPLDLVVPFMAAARQQRQTALVENLWKVLGDDPKLLAERAFATPLHFLVSFMTAAREQRQTALVENLWRALGGDPNRLANRAFDTPLGDLTVFISEARRQRQNTLAEGLCNALATDKERLTKSAFGTPLGDLATFIVTAHKQQQTELVRELWQALADNPTRLANRAFETALGDLASFVVAARGQQQSGLLQDLWKAFEAAPDRLTPKVFTVAPRDSARFFSQIPAEFAGVGPAVVQHLDIREWHLYEGQPARPLTGAPGLAVSFGRFGREDLKTALLKSVLIRASPRDFSDTTTGLLEVSRLLANVPDGYEPHVPQFVEAVATDAWLQQTYRFIRTHSLAAALTNIAMHQPPDIIRAFWRPSLEQRVLGGLDRVRGAPITELSTTIQLLGAYELMGELLANDDLEKLPLNSIGLLPEKILPHRAGSHYVEMWQRQLWYGMRVIARLSKDPIRTTAPLLEETLRLWRINLDESRTRSSSTIFRVSASMVRWLERCHATGNGTLLPDDEPLWVLTGFPKDRSAMT